jgi:hypothetical protein
MVRVTVDGSPVVDGPASLFPAAIDLGSSAAAVTVDVAPSPRTPYARRSLPISARCTPSTQPRPRSWRRLIPRSTRPRSRCMSMRSNKPRRAGGRSCHLDLGVPGQARKRGIGSSITVPGPAGQRVSGSNANRHIYLDDVVKSKVSLYATSNYARQAFYAFAWKQERDVYHRNRRRGHRQALPRRPRRLRMAPSLLKQTL